MRFPSATALRVFDAAARHGSFKAAAGELGITATAVSHQIRGLEGQLGQALFERRVRKVTLTAAGERLAAATGPGFRRIAEALEEIGTAARRLTITTTPAFAALWLVPRLRDFEARNPGIAVHVETSTGRVALDRDRRIDLAIRYGAAEEDGLPGLDERFGAFATPGYLADLRGLAAATLIETRWQSGALAPITWEDWFDVAGARLPASAARRAFEDEQHVINAGLAGQGVILVSTRLVADMLARGWLAPYRAEIGVPGYRYTCHLGAATTPTTKVRRFLDWLAGEAG